MALLGIAYGLIKWIGRTVRSLGPDVPRESARLEAMTSGEAAVAADALVRQGIVSAAELERMTPREREFFVAAATPQLKTGTARTTTHRRTPVASDVVSGNPRATPHRRTPAANDVVASSRADRNREANLPPRLHLITPSRPPLGMAVHCPGCGVPLDRDALQRVGATNCPRCKRPVTAHIQRGRLTVIIEETPDEAAHRRRLDGGQ